MRKYIFLVLLAAIFILGACANGEETSGDKKSEGVQTEQDVKSETEGNKETEEKAGNEEKRSPLRTKNSP